MIRILLNALVIFPEIGKTDDCVTINSYHQYNRSGLKKDFHHLGKFSCPRILVADESIFVSHRADKENTKQNKSLYEATVLPQVIQNKLKAET